MPEWLSPVAPAVTQARHRGRALAPPGAGSGPWPRWAGAAGFGLVAWGLGTEAPTRAEAQENIEQQKAPDAQAWHRGAGLPPPSRKPGLPASRWRNALDVLEPSIKHGLRGAVGPAQPAAADGARHRRRSPARCVLCPAGARGQCSGAGRGTSPPGAALVAAGSVARLAGSIQPNRSGRQQDAASTSV